MGSAQRPISSAFVFQHWENRSRQESEVAHTSARAYLCRCAPGQPSPNLRIITCVQFSRCVSRQIDLAFSVAMAGYCGFATPVPPHAGQVVTWGSLSRGRFGNRPSGVSSHDICPPPWRIGHWRISSSAIQRSGGFLPKGSCGSDESNHLRFNCCALYITASPQNPQIGLNPTRREPTADTLMQWLCNVDRQQYRMQWPKSKACCAPPIS